MEKSGNHATESSETHLHKSEDHDNNQHSDESEQKLHTTTPESKSESSEPSLVEVMEAVDDFINALSTEKDPLREIPAAVEPFPETVDSLVSKMESSGLGRDESQDSAFIDAVNRISKSVIRLRELKLDSTPVSSWLNRASSVQHRAVSLLDEEFRHLLDRSREEKKKKNINDGNNSDHNNQKHSSSNSSTNESDRCVLQDHEEEEEESFPDFSPESMLTLKKIAGAMISAGYEAECCMSYDMSRRHAFKEELSEVGFEGINVEDVQRIAWDSLEGEIASWISIVRRCSTVLFPGELSLCSTVFPDDDHAAIRKRLFTGLVSAVTIRFLDFSGAVVLTKRSSEKLFKFLDMYETLRDLIPAVVGYSDLIQEIKLAQTRLGEAAVTIFGELEKSIKSDNGRTPVPSRAVHPLTRYTMNYLKYACEYKDTLDQVFQHYESNQTDTKPEPDVKWLQNFYKILIELSLLRIHVLFLQRAVHEGTLICRHLYYNGHQPMMFLANTLINMYVKFNLLNDAHHLFDQMPQRNVISWTTMISAYSKCKLHHKDLELLVLMVRDGVRPNVYTYSSVLRACNGLFDVRMIHYEIIKEGLESDVYVRSALIDVFAKLGEPEDALHP